MTKSDLEHYRAICIEIKQLKKEIADESSRDVQTDSVMASDYGPAYGMRSVMIQGLSLESQNKLDDLMIKLMRRKAERIRLRDEIERYFDAMDGETATILRARYIERQKWRDIAQALGKSEDAIKKRIQRL